jgi:hypothetical protein
MLWCVVQCVRRGRITRRALQGDVHLHRGAGLQISVTAHRTAVQSMHTSTHAQAQHAVPHAPCAAVALEASQQPSAPLSKLARAGLLQHKRAHPAGTASQVPDMSASVQLHERLVPGCEAAYTEFLAHGCNGGAAFDFAMNTGEYITVCSKKAMRGGPL